MSGPTWEDNGPISQGKIITAIIQQRNRDALVMLRGWLPADRRILQEAARQLDRMIRRLECPERHEGMGGSSK